MRPLGQDDIQKPRMSHESDDAEKPIGILVTGLPLASVRRRCGGFDALIRAPLAQQWRGAWEVIDCRSEAIPRLDRYLALVITGSSSSVLEREAWMLALEMRLREAVEAQVFVLGICFGHQILATALGGKVSRNPRGRELGIVRTQPLGHDEVFGASLAPTLVYMAHEDTVVVPPACARVCARTEDDAHAALRLGPRAWSVQFHPEFDAFVMSQYLDDQPITSVSNRVILAAKAADATVTVEGRNLLTRFVQIASNAQDNANSRAVGLK